MGRSLSTTLTLIIHGTFASEAAWWRLGEDGQGSFADRLERGLSRRGLAQTVWKPALANGFDYSCFRWSGRNRHTDRVAGARHLSIGLNQLAKQLRATRDEPLIVNFVAHSHGGNVALEALRHLKQNVSIGRIVLLGTPLLTTRPAFRLGRFVFSAVLITFLFLAVASAFIVFIELASCLWNGQSSCKVMGGDIDRWALLIFILVLPLYAWIFWLAGNVADVAWRLLCRILEPLSWLRGKDRSLVYGPSPSKLRVILQGRHIRLCTTYNDEADVLLQVTSAPGRLYRDYVATSFSNLERLLEFAFIRPFVTGVFLKAIEMPLVVFSLGFSVWRTLFQDFEVGSAENSYYPTDLLVRQSLNIHPRMTALAVPVSSDVGHHDDGIESEVAPPRGLRLSVGEITKELATQVRLRHSAYYDNDEVIDSVADFLTGTEVGSAEKPQSFPLRPSHEFWEALLVANIGLWVFAVCIRGTPLPPSSTIWTVCLHSLISQPTITSLVWAGNAVPFIFWGVSISRAAWRKRRDRLWRRFWIVWAIWGLCILLVSATVLR